MPDISAFMRGGGPCEEISRKCRTMDAKSGCACAVAADEIDRLRGTVMNLCVAHGKLGDENEELRARICELDGFIKTIEEQATALEEDNRKLRVEAGNMYPVANGDPLKEEDILIALGVRATEIPISSVEFDLNRRAVKEIRRLRELAGYLTEERRQLRVEAGYD
jgi:regulator of replication initiation timing